MRRRGLTLTEVLVAIAIVAVLGSLLLGAVQSARESTRRMECSNKIRQIGIATAHRLSLTRTFPTGTGKALGAREFQSWMVQLLPFVEQTEMSSEIEEAYRFQSSPFRPLRHPHLSVLNPNVACPSDPFGNRLQFSLEHQLLVGPTSYLGTNGTNSLAKDGLLFYDSKVEVRDLRDGLSNTLLVGERPISGKFNFGWWYAGIGVRGDGTADHTLGIREVFDESVVRFPCPPRDFQFPKRAPDSDCDGANFWSYHPGGAYFGLADGSVRFFAYGSDKVLFKLSTRSGEELIDFDE